MPDAETMKLLFDMESVQSMTIEERTRKVLPFMMSQEFIDKNPSVIEQIVAKMTEHPRPPHGYTRQAQAAMGHDTYERLPEIKAPTLVIAGDVDRLVPVENSRILASWIPRAELVILENMGHGFFYEAEEETNRVILDFLRRHPAKNA
jgi:pimeloyl-ACP methyl ester carboxylesterase